MATSDSLTQTLYLHLPGLFIGTLGQYYDTFGISSIEHIVNNASSQVTFAWLKDDEFLAFMETAEKFSRALDSAGEA